MLKVIAAEKLLCFVGVAEHDVAVVTHDSTEIIGVAAEQKRVGESEGCFDA